MILSFINKNAYKDYLDINFWNYKWITESIDRENMKELEKSLFKTFILSKNNSKITKELSKYFIKNNSKFFIQFKKIMKNFL